MTYQEFDPKYVASRQLDTALQLYFDGKDYFSVITLAGAADEILGKLLATRDIDNSLESLKKAVVAIHLKLYGEQLNPKQVADRANRAKNALKHYNKEAFSNFTLDVKEEAEDMLNRAIDNFWLLEERMSPLMVRYERFKRESMGT